MSAPSCVFCRLIADQESRFLVYEDDAIVAFLDRAPRFVGHTLVVPRAHVETLDELSEDLVGPLFTAARLVARAMPSAFGADGALLTLNERVDQTVPHAHVHVIPRKEGDGFLSALMPRSRYADPSAAIAAQEALRASIAELRGGPPRAELGAPWGYAWVDDGLAIGAALNKCDIPVLRALGISSVVDCRDEGRDDEALLAEHGVSYLHLPTPDRRAISPEHLEHGISWIREHLDAGQRVYVHCRYGVGRAPFLVCCYFVARGEPVYRVVARVSAARRVVAMSTEQLRALLAYEQSRAFAGSR